MAQTIVRRSRRLILLSCALGALALLGPGGSIPKTAGACATCFSESATAYWYCQSHPVGTWYHGCNFSVRCGSGTYSANEIYTDNCVF